MTIVYLVRHGRTALNASGQLRGRLDPPLDEAGLVEAEALGRQFSGIDVAVVVSSPLRRASQTAESIAAACNLSVAYDDRLIDRDYGSWAGRGAADLVRRFGSIDTAPGVEAPGSVAARAVSAVVAAAERVAPGTAVIVAHDAVNRAVLSQLAPALGPADSIPQRTGCWNRLEHEEGVWRASVVDTRPDLGDLR